MCTYLRHARRATIASPELYYASEEGFFALGRQFCGITMPDPTTSLARLHAKSADAGTALVLATGPSAALIDPAEVTHDVRIICNSAVRDRKLLEQLRPDVIAFGDPVFHHGPSRYAAAFRDDLLTALELTDAVILTSQLFAEPLVAHVPEVVDRLAVLPLSQEVPWGWPTPERPMIRLTGNVLTNLMLPAAFALSRHVTIAGCDGRDPNERYFWRHDTRAQYDDTLMQTAFDAHPAFFRDRVYADYYNQHCQQLEELLAAAEAMGKVAIASTPSHIPALLERGAPAFAEQVRAEIEAGSPGSRW